MGAGRNRDLKTLLWFNMLKCQFRVASVKISKYHVETELLSYMFEEKFHTLYTVITSNCKDDSAIMNSRSVDKNISQISLFAKKCQDYDAMIRG